MAHFLTARQLQDILQVDRTTIYRLANSGRIPGLKVGNQWRFPRQQVEDWLKEQRPMNVGNAERIPDRADDPDVRELLPLECVQQIQDVFADALGVMIIMTDLEGQPITKPSNPCGLYTATSSSPAARKRYMDLWTNLTRNTSLQSAFVENRLGLLFARGSIRVDSELRATLLVGGIAPKEWPPTSEKVQWFADYLDLDPVLVHHHINEVFSVDASEHQHLLSFVQRIDDIVEHIITERSVLFTKLQNIVELTQALARN